MGEYTRFVCKHSGIRAVCMKHGGIKAEHARFKREIIGENVLNSNYFNQ